MTIEAVYLVEASSSKGERWADVYLSAEKAKVGIEHWAQRCGVGRLRWEDDSSGVMTAYSEGGDTIEWVYKVVPLDVHRDAQSEKWWLDGAVKVRRAIRNEPALISALLFGFVVIKVIYIAHGDIQTALGVFNSAGLATVLVGGLLSSFPLVSAVALGLATFKLISQWDAIMGTIWLVTVVSCLVLTPWPIMVLSAALGFGFGCAARKRKSEEQSHTRKIARYVTLIALSVVSLILVLNPLLYGVWLPHEELTLGKQPRTPDGGGTRPKRQ
jgi:hypothetical protein